MSSAVEICNLALQKVGAKSITSLSDDSVAARECNRVYEHLRDAELRAYPWVFAKKRAQIAASSTSPVFGYDNAFPLPSDYLRLHRDFSDVAASDGVVPLDWTIEGNEILTNDDAPLNVVYIRRVTDANAMDVLFREALACRIGLTIAEKLTQSNSKRQLSMGDYEAAITEARRTGAIESPPEVYEEDSWISARR